MRGRRTPAEIIKADELNFRREVLLSELPVLVYFEHPYEEGCRGDMEMIRDLATILTKSVKYMKADMLYSDKLASYVELGDKPGLIIYKDGEQVAKFQTPLDRAKIRLAIRKLIKEE